MPDFASIKFQPNRPLLRELSADRLNTILQEIKRNKPKGERGITVRQDGTGTYIGLAAALTRGGSTPITRQPWDLIARQDPENENQYLVRVQPGTLNGILPSNWDEEFECAATGLYYAKAVIATDGQEISGLTIQIDDNVPQIQEPQEFGLQNPVEYLFGLFGEGEVYRVISDGHIDLRPLLWMTVSKDSPAQPGELPWVQYYQLQ